MGFKQQLSKITDNWLIIVILLLVLMVMSGLGGISSNLGALTKTAGYSQVSDQMAAGGGYSAMRESYYPTPSSDFAPGVTERKLIKTSSMGLSAEHGQFDSAQDKLHAIVTVSGSYLLNENVNKYGEDKKAYRSGYYQIKVEKAKYDALVAQLKEIGEVTSFSESTQDITGAYTNNEIELQVEQERLLRYKEMYKTATIVADQITINDRIFDEERTIKYLQDSLKNKDQQVDYSQVQVSLNEKQSGYANLLFVKFSDLIRTLVGSTNAVFYIIFALLPFAVVAAIIWFIVWLIRRR
ncbi:MAG: DUF4349 domain-containing protein [Candidatus Woesearchaeota archaeon]